MAVKPALSALIGIWRGEGSGEFPTMESFRYREEVEFRDIGAPFLVYLQRAWSAEDGELLHAEAGVWRVSDDGRLAVTVALPRVSEVSEGRVGDGVIDLASTSVRRAEGGSALTATRRRYRRDGDELRYEIEMATASVSETTRHLAGTLRRLAEPPSSQAQSMVK